MSDLMAVVVAWGEFGALLTVLAVVLVRGARR